ncbi:hypothetical protein CN488_21000 [Bacillus anthracis]|uniref:hypothetical protein n=1 Tax=Bacillus cereus group TaxID=86661 RepID=UPI000BF5E5D4|nr:MULTISPECIES: hypothetical protein [Bacillus cereus group]PES20781.1 hypothetical protein CN488_21000 [Bacillus anthracis]PGR23476.1 hypothetical protein COC50_15220 [Bacillus anthracis]PHF07094.1 hypothetical protein COF74_17685 [Bacillus wiedmannii]PHF92597.1 hypothetical protein COI45_20755 [Bacillus wiedmannii]PHG69891.1 hypothetical protein COI55_13260 [Bacillus wiedmannii]
MTNKINLFEYRLPKRLKDYFGLTDEFKDILTETKIKDISDAFIEYSTLYCIEDGAFSQIAIECLRRSQNDEKFGYHLKYQLTDKKDSFVVESNYSGLTHEEDKIQAFFKFGRVGFELLGYNTYDEMKEAGNSILQKLTEKEAVVLCSNFLMCWHSVLQNSDDSMKAYLSLREFIANHSAKETDGVIIKPRKIKRRKIQKRRYRK